MESSGKFDWIEELIYDILVLMNMIV